MIKVFVFEMSKRVLIAGKHSNPIKRRKRDNEHSGIVDDNSKINKELCFITWCNTTSKEDYWKKRKFIICQYQYTIQVNLRYLICYDDHDIICSLKKQGKKITRKV